MLIVIKVGGGLLKEGLSKGLLNDLVTLHREHQLILVHGGADIVTEISTQLGHPPKFVVSPGGFKSRYTSKEESRIFTMVMTGLINKQIVAAMESRGIAAMGLSGLDAHLVRATRKKRLIIVDEKGRRKLIEGGFTGKVQEINVEIINLLLENGITPVLSPVAIGEEYEPLNVDGDRIASEIASAMKADRLILLTDVNGIFLDNDLVPKLNIDQTKEAMNHIGAGMVTKAYAAVEAVKNGVQETIIASGLFEKPITEALAHNECTVITS